MIQDAPLIRAAGGFKLKNDQVYIDPLEPVETAIISHAHGDHAVPGHHTVYCSLNTARILRAKYYNFAYKVITPEWNTPFKAGNTYFTLFPAGHMLGSAQVLWESGGNKILYTGDFKIQDDPTCEPCYNVECDILITETTFANPAWSHPSPEKAIEKLKDSPPLNFIIAAYTIGKAQRLTRLFNDFLPERKIMVHHKISRYHRLYKEAGFDPGPWLPFQRRVFKYHHNFIYIIPPSILPSFLPSHLYLRGMASGWERLQEGLELNVPISDHADWNDILFKVNQSKCSKVYTVHGDGTKLKEYFSDKAIEIEELIA